MNRFKQCTYSIILILTCVVASPMIFRQIWTTSAEKKKENKVSIEDIDISKGLEEQSGKQETSGSDISGVQQNTAASSANGNHSNPASEPMASTSAEETTEQIYYRGFVQGDYSYFDNALFIGDSRTVGIREYGSLGNADFYCEEGLSTADAKKSSANGELSKLLSSGKYKKVYVMLGINEVGNDLDGTFAIYKGIIENIRVKAPEAIIFIQANMHVTFDTQSNSVNNERINALNNKISTLADSQKIFYIDVNDIFDDDKGNLEAGYTSDGIHVYAAAYPKWCEWYCQKTIPVS